MSDFIVLLGWAGIYAPVALGSIGSAYGCARAGQAAAGALLDTDSGYGKFIGLAIDKENQADLTDARLKDWVELLKKGFGL